MTRLLLLALVAAPLLPADAFLMWQAQKDDRIIHLLAAAPFVSGDAGARTPREMDQAYEDAKVLVFESDPDPARRQAGRREILEVALYPENDSLLNHLPDALLRQYRQVCRELTIEGQNINRMQPWMAAQNLLRIALAQAKVRLGEDLETRYFRRAVMDDKPMAFLNTPRKTIDLYTSMTPAEHLRIFEKALRDTRTLTNFLPAVEAAWRAADAEAATRLMVDSFAGFEDVHQRLFVDRNAAWAADLDDQAGIEGQVMAVVNLSHLVGGDSLLDRLANRGYRIAQVVPE